MKKTLTTIILLLASVLAFAQEAPITADPSNAGEPISQILLPILFMGFLIFMLITLIRYFLEFRLKSKLIDSGMAEQLSAYLVDKNAQEKRNEAVKLAILFCGIGAGLAAAYWTAPLHLHSLAIMAFSLGLSYLAYFFYLRR